MLSNPNTFICVAVSWLSLYSTHVSDPEKKLSRGMSGGALYSPRALLATGCNPSSDRLSFWQTLQIRATVCQPFFSLLTIANGDEN